MHDTCLAQLEIGRQQRDRAARMNDVARESRRMASTMVASAERMLENARAALSEARGQITPTEAQTPN
jgi:hypothetical protein